MVIYNNQKKDIEVVSMHHKLTNEDKKAIKKLLDIKGYDPDTFDPEILDQLESNDEYKNIIKNMALTFLFHLNIWDLRSISSTVMLLFTSIVYMWRSVLSNFQEH